MQAFLLYNPKAGRRRRLSSEWVVDVANVLRDGGYVVQVAATEGPDTATRQAAEAIARGAQVVFACGGDGTVHQVLQAVAGSSAQLAILPAGTANAFARYAGIPRNLLKAARAYAQARVVELPIAQLVCCPNGPPRKFLSMAGAGADGALAYRMLTVERSAMGRWMYAVHALGLLLRMRFPTFRVTWTRMDGTFGSCDAVTSMALRIGSLGGVFPGVARGASPFTNGVRLVLVRPPAGLALPLWMAGATLGLTRWNPFVVSEDVRGFEWHINRDVQMQVDGELARLGIDPKRVVHGEVSQAKLLLLSPRGCRLERLQARLSNGAVESLPAEPRRESPAGLFRGGPGSLPARWAG